MKYRLDLHLHTENSPDSRLTLTQAVAAAKRRGIDALAVSDHNRCPDAAVFARPLRDGVLLIPSVEYSTELGHLLGIFLQEPCHVAGEESGRVRFRDAAESIHAAGGLCILAHPFELTRYKETEIAAQIHANAQYLDGIEVFNRRATKKRKNANALAAAACEGTAFLRTAGSDAHTKREVGGASITIEADALTLSALREALFSPLEFSCGKCRQLAIEHSQFIRLRKTHACPKAYCRWLLFAAVCLLRSVKGVFQ